MNCKNNAQNALKVAIFRLQSFTIVSSVFKCNWVCCYHLPCYATRLAKIWITTALFHFIHQELDHCIFI